MPEDSEHIQEPTEDEVKAPSEEHVEPESKPADEKPEASKDAEDTEGSEESEESAEGPEEYEFELPENGVDKDLLENATAIFKDLKLPKDQAQKVVDLWANKVKADEEALDQQVESWEAEIKAIPKYEEKASAVKRMFADLELDDDTREIFDNSWFGSHPGIFKFLAKAADKLVDPDHEVESGRGAPGRQLSHAERIYGTK